MADPASLRFKARVPGQLFGFEVRHMVGIGVILLFLGVLSPSELVPHDLHGWGIAALLVGALGLVYATDHWMARRYVVVIDATGSAGFSRWGRRLTCTWDAIAVARRRRSLGYPYVRLEPRGARTSIWVPLLMDDRSAFADACARFAGEANPMVQALRETGA